MSDLVTHLSQKLRGKGKILALAESCTGGLIASQITELAGSSDIFDRGFVTYSNESKQNLLGVSAATLKEYGAVSEQTALEMAKGALKNSNADYALSVTGIAGPGGGSDEKPVGLVYIGLASKEGMLGAYKCLFDGDRQAVRAHTSQKALSLLLEELEQ